MTAETETPAGTEAETEAVVEPERPAWLPPQFDTPKMLAKSWKEASQKITMLGQDNKAQRDENEILTQEVQRLVAERDVFEDRIGTLERGLLNRLVGRRGA